MKLHITPAGFGWLHCYVPAGTCWSCRGTGDGKGPLPGDRCRWCAGSGGQYEHVEIRDCSKLVGQILASVGHVRSGSIGAGKVAA